MKASSRDDGTFNQREYYFPWTEVEVRRVAENANSQRDVRTFFRRGGEKRESKENGESGRIWLGMASEKISGRLVRGDARAGSSVSLATNWKYRGLSRTSRRPGTLEEGEGISPRGGNAASRDIKLLEITSAYYFNFVDCLTAVTPRIPGPELPGKVFLG